LSKSVKSHQAKTVNFILAFTQVTATIPSSIAYPISIESIYVAQGKSEYKGKGTVFFDYIIANY